MIYILKAKKYVLLIFQKLIQTVIDDFLNDFLNDSMYRK